MPAGRDLTQERHGLHDPAGVPRRDVHVLGQVRADRDEDRVEVAIAPLGGQVGDPVPAGDGHAEGLDPADLGGDHVAGQPVGGDPVAHHPAGLGAGVPDLHLMTQPGQVIRGRQPARPGPDDQHPLAGGRRRGIEGPALVQRQVAEEPLHRVDRHRAVQLGPVAHGLAGVVTNPPVDGGQRVVRYQLPPGGLRPPGLDLGQPGLDVLPAGQPALHGGSRSRYTGRRSRTGPARAASCTRSGNGVMSWPSPFPVGRCACGG